MLGTQEVIMMTLLELPRSLNKIRRKSGVKEFKEVADDSRLIGSTTSFLFKKYSEKGIP